MERKTATKFQTAHEKEIYLLYISLIPLIGWYS